MFGFFKTERNARRHVNIFSVLVVLAAPAVAAEAVGQTDEEFVESLIYWGITAVIYLFVAPPLVYGYLRLRWFNRSTIETFFQYYLMFAFFPARLPRYPLPMSPFPTVPCQHAAVVAIH
ncbi:unnamed protein product [Closterium sp. Naga37s-1]|nr:unnamed protein product [Closterium sp. Naga37s-1]